MIPNSTISVVGLRAYPSAFIGTSGVEVYTENIMRCLKTPSLSFTIYTRARYQKTTLSNNVIVKPLPSIHSKTLETISYACLASIQAALDTSTVVWYHGVGPSFFSFIPHLFGKRVVITVHSLDWKRTKWNPLERILFWLISNAVFLTKPITTTVSQELYEFLSSKNSRVFYAPPGIHKISSPSKKGVLSMTKIPTPYILFLGRIVPEKHIERIIKAWRVYKKKYPHTSLVIAGGHGNIPHYEKFLKNQYRDVDLYWVGYVFGETKQDLLSRSGCFVLASDLEGLPLSLMEALSLGKTCVVPNNILHNNLTKLSNIFIYPNNNEPRFVKAIVKAMHHKSAAYSQREQRVLQEFSWAKSARVYHKLFTLETK